jgi:peptidoglycan/LPS O-acetylase OafA/YrhL
VAALAILGPKILLLLPAWLLGSVAYRLSQRKTSDFQAWALAMGGALTALTIAGFKLGNLYVTWRLEQLIGAEVFALLGHSQAFVSDNLIAVGFAAHLVGMSQLLRSASLPTPLTSAIRICSLATFPIYLLHYPALYFFTALSVRVTSEMYGVAIGVASLALGVMVTPVAERFKRTLRNTLTKPLQSFNFGLNPPKA